LIGRTGGKRPFGRPRHRWEHNVRMYLRKIGWEVVDGMHLAQDRDQWWSLLNMALNLWVP